MNIEKLRSWFVQNRRLLPWRSDSSPYSVWISEVMLQQTQASRVVGYFMNWMHTFPTIFDLAKATEEEVLKCWEGLGYYSRAKALHAAAQDIVKRFGGVIPRTNDELRSIKGLGPYTTGAILAFGYHQKEAAVDANVMRVLTRHFALQEDVCKQATQKALYRIASDLLPEKAPWEITEALIELGALVCQKKPECKRCPVQGSCQAHKLGIQDALPVKSARMQYEALFREVAVIKSERERFLVRQGVEGRPCAGLYEFAYFDCSEGGLLPDVVEKMIFSKLALKASFEGYLEEQKHSFTRFRVRLYPKLYVAKEKEVPAFRWCSFDEAEKLTFSSGHKRILHHLPSATY